MIKKKAGRPAELAVQEENTNIQGAVVTIGREAVLGAHQTLRSDVDTQEVGAVTSHAGGLGTVPLLKGGH